MINVRVNLFLITILLCCSIMSAQAQIISTIAGNNVKGYSGDDSLANKAMLNQPAGVCTDAAGNIYIADQYNNRVRKVDAKTGIITTVAGNGTAGYTGDSALAAFVGLYWPIAVAVDASNNLYISDCLNNRIRKVNLSTGYIVTIAGDSSAGYSGDNGLAINAKLSYPAGITVDGNGNVYICDFGNAVIRKITAATGIITTVAGNGLSGYAGDGGLAINAKLLACSGIAVDASGNIFIADEGNNRIRRVAVSTGIITTVAGNGTAGYTGDGNFAASAELDGPQDILIDGSNNLYIADLNNDVIRKVSASTGKITTVAGDGTAGYSGDGGMATSAKLHSPMGVCMSATGNIYIADQLNNVVREVRSTANVTNIKATSFQLAPNPNNGKFSISFNILNSPYEITIYNIEGQVIYHNKGREKTAMIDLSNAITGNYFICIDIGPEKLVQKIIVTH